MKLMAKAFHQQSDSPKIVNEKHQPSTGEGVFGLRRAFVLAGAKTLVMSLWKVADEQTRELMEDFILAGEPRAEALRETQLAMKKKYPEPYYWGAFICQGDPGPLLVQG